MDLPDNAEGWGHMYISGKSQMYMLQVLCNTFIAIVTTPVDK